MHWLYRYASWKKAGFFLALNFTLQAIILLVFYPEISATLEPLDIRVGLTADAIEDFLGAIGSDGRALYFFNESVPDMLFPVAYAFAYALLMVQLIKACGQVHTPLKYLALLPFAIALSDILENLQMLVAIHSYPTIAPALVRGLAAANLAKHIFTTLVVSALGVLFVWLLCNRLCQVRIPD
ncbi:hypothetical protein ACONUD_10265 [Microbulbifer harenosus]|uniref:Uncharacterized protein n=1 Tax=Microbulbifer harenosus TaxID=2576840 RepID=A0ABY2UGA2_9GAMM|nr:MULTISPECIES: hypothetical protein [Microbulbifer]QIL91686.1 hypothetical protein GNX18_19285 [Microbulbifer sp. SH-1]TLM76710.1 hypothetical protein FDY93_12145 [Microbulbifer harenosus]